MGTRQVLRKGKPWPLLGLFLFGVAPVSAADFGGVGLLDMPTARMRADGQFTLGTSQQGTEDVYSVTYQALPWLEGTFRYIVSNPSKKSGSADDVRDRSFDVKFRLLEESTYLPSVAFGLRDFVGTGVFSSEYLVASKAYGPLDISLGMGWGRLATRDAFDNPVSAVFGSEDRNLSPRIQESGRLQVDQFFTGQSVGVFGGAELALPYGTRLIAEYTSDDYGREQRLGTLDDPSPFSYGLGWRPAKGIDVVASRQLGTDYALSVTASLDTIADAAPKAVAPFWSVAEPRARRDDAQGYEPNSWYARLLYDVERSGLLLLSGDLREGRRSAWLEIENSTFAYEADAIQRVLTLAELHLPRSVRTIHVLVQTDGITQSHVRYQRRLTALAEGQYVAASEALLTVLAPHPMPESPDFATAYRKPTFNFRIDLGQRLMIMDPDDPLRYQILGRLSLGADLGDDWYIRSSLALNIYNDWDTIKRRSDSTLPRVRSEVRRYLQEGATGLDSLYLEKRGMLEDDLVFRAYGGILEEMYSGVGFEALYRPFQSRVAFGVNANYVWQRDYDKRFSYLDYSVLTGHGSVYWATPFANYDAALHVGRYLARDFGGTFELRRTFSNGWMVGGFFTLTEVPFDEFGEGSFDKGLFFRIPFNSLLPGNSRGAYQTVLRTIQRDGGARLEGVETLWWESRGHRIDTLNSNRSRMLPR